MERPEQRQGKVAKGLLGLLGALVELQLGHSCTASPVEVLTQAIAQACVAQELVWRQRPDDVRSVRSRPFQDTKEATALLLNGPAVLHSELLELGLEHAPRPRAVVLGQRYIPRGALLQEQGAHLL